MSILSMVSSVVHSYKRFRLQKLQKQSGAGLGYQQQAETAGRGPQPPLAVPVQQLPYRSYNKHFWSKTTYTKETQKKSGSCYFIYPPIFSCYYIGFIYAVYSTVYSMHIMGRNENLRSQLPWTSFTWHLEMKWTVLAHTYKKFVQ